MSIVQEKFQYLVPNQSDGDSNWVSDKSARVKKGTPGREGGGEPSVKQMDTAVMYNSLPPGMDIEDQEQSDQRVMPMSMGGETDVSHDYNMTSVRDGYKRKPMRPTDDMYTNEHVDMFYAEAKSDGDVGFIERGNLLDRL